MKKTREGLGMRFHSSSHEDLEDSGLLDRNREIHGRHTEGTLNGEAKGSRE